MEQRSRFKKVIHKGYTLGIWHSAFVHHVLLLILFFIVVRSPQVEDLGVITLNFSDPKPTLVIEPALKMDFDSMSDSIEVASSVSEISDSELPKLVEQKPELQPEQKPIQEIDEIKIEDLHPEDLMAEVSEKTSDTKSTLFDKKTPISNKRIKTKKIPKAASILDVPVSSNSNNGNALKKLIKGGTSLGDGIPKSWLAMGSASAGKPGDAEARLKFYGAGTGDIQISLIWNTVDDIDLWVSDGRDIICWRDRRSITGGILDIDMNANGPDTNRPIENVFWPFNTAPRSHYTVAIELYRCWSNNQAVPVKVRIKTLKGVSYYDVIAVRGAGIQQVIQFSN